MQGTGLQKQQVIEKAVSFSFAGAAVAFLPIEWLVIVFILMGQGHFFSAYLYQLKAGKIGWKYATAWVVMAGLIVSGALLLENPRMVAVIASIYFIHHFWVDERHLIGDSPKPGYLLESLPFILLYMTSVFYSAQYFDWRLPVSIIGAALIIYVFARDLVTKEPFNTKKLYFLLLNAGILAFCLFGGRAPFERLMGFVILAHYSNWYLNYFFKFSDKKKVLHSYLRNIFIVNAIVIGAFLLMIHGPYSMRFLEVFFTRNAFYLWAIIHILFTTRKKDFAYWGLTFAKQPS